MSVSIQTVGRKQVASIALISRAIVAAMDSLRADLTLNDKFLGRSCVNKGRETALGAAPYMRWMISPFRPKAPSNANSRQVSVPTRGPAAEAHRIRLAAERCRIAIQAGE